MYQGSKVRRDINPRETANIFSIISFAFAFGIFKKSTKAELIEDDIYKVLENTAASELGDKIELEWHKEKKKAHPSLTKLIFRVWGKEYMAYGFLKLVMATTVLIIRPLATGKLVGYFDKGSTQTLNDVCFYAAIVIGTSVIYTMYVHYYDFSLAHLGLRLKISLCSLMYRKSLKLSDSSLNEITNGKIVTMMAKDVNIFDSAMILGHDIWTGFIHVILMAYVMYGQIGPSALVGLAFFITITPVQLWMGFITKRLRLKTAGRTDQRLRRIQEILTSIKLIKYYTWEKYFTKITSFLRKLEVNKIRKIYFVKILLTTLTELSYRASFFICILVYSFLGNTLTAETAFVAVGCYQSLYEVVCFCIPNSVTQFAEAKTSIKRIKQYLLAKDVQNKMEEKENIIKSVKVFTNNVSVSILEKEVLHEINFQATSPSLIGITGCVGSGKSMFLKTLLGDTDITKGDLVTTGDVSYASQEPWLFPATIRQNILFGAPFDQKRYQEVLKVCALIKDFESFPNKDHTVVGDKGVNLSMGQRTRINLARAVYKNCDIYLMDDILSSLDAKVSKFVFDECIKGFLKNKLCILVCHNKRLLKYVDRLLVFNDGKIEAEGTLEDIKDNNISIDSYSNIDSNLGAENADIKVEDEQIDDTTLLLPSKDVEYGTEIYGETKEKGKVKFSTYKSYFDYAGSWKLIPPVMLFLLGSKMINLYFGYYLTEWLKVEEELSLIKYNLTQNPDNQNITSTYEEQISKRNQTLLYYNLILGASVVGILAELFSFFGVAARAGKILHIEVFNKVMGASMSFFDKHLSGNILNRFSKDIGVIDENLPTAYFETTGSLFHLCLVIIAIISINVYLLLPAFLLLLFMMYSRNHYLFSSRSLKRMEAITRAPVIGYLNSSLEGLTTIRANGNQEILIHQFDRHIDLNSSAMYMFITIANTFGFWLDMTCNLFIVAVIFTFIFMQDKLAIPAGEVGFALTQSFGITRLMKWGIKQWAEVENTTVSVERVIEYTNAEQENVKGIDPDNWPTRGRIEYKDVNLKYQNSGEYCLKDINFTIEPQEKVGIIGRTGAGKSSIISTLFRLYDTEGDILIDGVNIKNIELNTARSKISIIPQDPIMFEGTIRANLDPNEEYTDNELWRALGEVQLKPIVEDIKMGLSSPVDYGGSNFSAGQRQLFCLARAVLRNNKILILDEATANIDPTTDALIQETVKRVFVDCTTLTIAHRLNTVINSNKIIVVDGGRVVEFDDPNTLLGRKTGIFYNLAKQSGLIN